MKRDNMLPLCRVEKVEMKAPEQSWLIQSLWTNAAVGIVGGAPKCCKSWFGLDMAVSVASDTPCLGRFPVHSPGKALVFLAEDALYSVRQRIEAICVHRGLSLSSLELYIITVHALRLDLAEDQQRLDNTLAAMRPRLLVLDPLVRMHQLDENSAHDISRLLGFIRQLQRNHDTAIVLVHHASKKRRSHPGQGLRGSSDLHAFGDSNAYLARREDHISLTIEHRSAKPPDPLELQLVSRSDGTATHLEITSSGKMVHNSTSIADRVLEILNRSDIPKTRKDLRLQLRINNQRLGDTLAELEKNGLIFKGKKGWSSTFINGKTKDNPKREVFENKDIRPEQGSLFSAFAAT